MIRVHYRCRTEECEIGMMGVCGMIELADPDNALVVGIVDDTILLAGRTRRDWDDGGVRNSRDDLVLPIVYALLMWEDGGMGGWGDEGMG